MVVVLRRGGRLPPCLVTEQHKGVCVCVCSGRWLWPPSPAVCRLAGKRESRREPASAHYPDAGGGLRCQLGVGLSSATASVAEIEVDLLGKLTVIAETNTAVYFSEKKKQLVVK